MSFYSSSPTRHRESTTFWLAEKNFQIWSADSNLCFSFGNFFLSKSGILRKSAVNNFRHKSRLFHENIGNRMRPPHLLRCHSLNRVFKMHMMMSSNGNIFRVTGPVNSPHKGQWCGAWMFSLISVWINGWVNNSEAGDLRRHRAHYDVILMNCVLSISSSGITVMKFKYLLLRRPSMLLLTATVPAAYKLDHCLRIRSLLVSLGDSNVWPGGLLQATVECRPCI